MRNPRKNRRKQLQEPHDEKTCFRCRLHALYEEVGNKHDNDPKFMIMAMAEACGSMLSQLDDESMILFMLAVQKFANEDNEGMFQTRH